MSITRWLLLAKSSPIIKDVKAPLNVSPKVSVRVQHHGLAIRAQMIGAAVYRQE